ncbi:MAG TPA: class II aldolase/adducin family protein [Phenylobacterium sp.]
MSTEELKREVARVYRELAVRGLNIGSSGNVSARSGDRILITCSGATGDIDEGDIVEIDLEGAYEGGLKPSSEWEMHTALYRTAPHAQAVVHTHSDACTALASLGEPLPAFHYMVLAFGGDAVRCAPYHTFGSPELAAAAAEAIAGSTACLLANHGMICHGRSLRAALDTAQRLEVLSRQYLLARSAGEPRILGPAEIADARARFATYGRRAAT